MEKENNYRFYRASFEGTVVDKYGSLIDDALDPLFIDGVELLPWGFYFTTTKHRHYRINGKHVR